MLSKKKKIIGAVAAGVLALGVLGGTTAFAAQDTSLTPAGDVHVHAAAAIAQPGTVEEAGTVTTDGDTYVTTGVSPVPALTHAEPAERIAEDTGSVSIVKNSDGSVSCVLGIAPEAPDGQTFTTSPAK